MKFYLCILKGVTLLWNKGIKQAALVVAVCILGVFAWHLADAIDSLCFLEYPCPLYASDVIDAGYPEGRPSSWENGTPGVVPVLPWPPPQASAAVKIPRSFFLESSINHALRESGDEVLLYDVFNQVLVALMNAGYHDFKCYAVPDGFALATRTETINPNGTPKQGRERWTAGHGRKPVFMPEPRIETPRGGDAGLYRMIVFVVTPHSFTETRICLDPDQERAWLGRGFNTLPEQLCEQPYTERHICTALVYEYAKAGPRQEARLSVPGTLPGKNHLVKSALWASLQQLWTLGPY